MVLSRPLFIPFNVRNKMINDIGHDINEIDQYEQYETLQSFMSEEDISSGLSKNITNGKMVGFDLNGWIKSRPTEYHYINPYQSLTSFSNPSLNRTPPPDGTSLKAYWQFNEASGDLINNAGSVPNNSTLGSAADGQNTSVTYSATGHIGDTYTYDGTTSRTTIGSSASQWNFMHNTTFLFTFAFWLKYTTTGTQRVVWSEELQSTANIGTNFTITTTEGAFFQVLNTSASFTQLDVSAGFIPDTTSWHLYLMTGDYALGSNNFKIRRDNANLNQIGITGTNSNSDSTNAMRLGVRSDDTAQFLTGSLDETSVWNKELSAADQTLLYNGGAGVELY